MRAGGRQQDLGDEHLVGTESARLRSQNGEDLSKVRAAGAIVNSVLMYGLSQHAPHLFDAFPN